MPTAERRRQLLDSGLELFKQQSYEEVSIEEIAEFAGVSAGLIYHYFPTKRDLVIAILRREQAELLERIEADASLDPPARFLASIEAFIDYVSERSAVYTTVFAARSGDPEIAALFEAGRARQLENLLSGLSDWPPTRNDPPPGPQLMSALQGWIYFVEGAVARWLQEEAMSREDLKSLLTTAFNGILQAARVSAAQRSS